MDIDEFLKTIGLYEGRFIRNEHGHMVEGNAIDKVKSGYDSPVEDGELRGPTSFSWDKIELEDKECVDYESDSFHPTSNPTRFPEASGLFREKFEVKSDVKYGMMNGGWRFRLDGKTSSI